MLEALGISCFLRILFSDKAAATAKVANRPSIKASFGELTDSTKLNEALDFCNELLKREEDRRAIIESKAFTLISITGVAAGLITGLAGQLVGIDVGAVNTLPTVVGYFRLFSSVLYLVSVLSMMCTIYLCMLVVSVGNYQFAYPNASDIFSLSVASLHYVRHERLVDLYYSFVINSEIVNRKGTYIRCAQTWFRNSVVLLIFMTLVLASTQAIQVQTSSSDPASLISTQAATVLPVATETATNTPQPSVMTSATPSPTVVIRPSSTITPTIGVATSIATSTP